MKTNLFTNIGHLLACALALGVTGCSKDSGGLAQSGAGGDGQAGSLARFAIMGNTLYTVDDTSLRTFDLSTPETPAPGAFVNMGVGVETIFPQDPYLFIGTQTGMHIYTTAGSTPRLLGTYSHVTSCDPVVVDGRYAYVTLRNDGGCPRGLNQLDVVDLQDLTRPVLASSYPLVKPFGLGTDSAQVFVCDQGIKVYDARTAPRLWLRQTFPIAATDVVARRGVLLVTGADGLYQYRYSSAGNGSLRLLSHIPLATN